MAAATVMMRPSTTHAISTLLFRSSRLFHSSPYACFHHRLLCAGKRLPLGTSSRLPHMTGRGGGGGGGGGRVGEVVLSVQRRLGGVRAAQVNDPGSIDSPMMQSMENKIREELNSDIVTVKDAYGDGRHVSIYVVSSAFEGQSSVNRQRMVYKAIWEELQSTVHAVDQMVTVTPGEAEK